MVTKKIPNHPAVNAAFLFVVDEVGVLSTMDVRKRL